MREARISSLKRKSNAKLHRSPYANWAEPVAHPIVNPVTHSKTHPKRKLSASLSTNAGALRERRKLLQESQERFWQRFGVTQSRGSRFELGQEIPQPVALLLCLYWRGTITERNLKAAHRICKHRR